jgi:hypothetical protein
VFYLAAAFFLLAAGDAGRLAAGEAARFFSLFFSLAGAFLAEGDAARALAGEGERAFFSLAGAAAFFSDLTSAFFSLLGAEALAAGEAARAFGLLGAAGALAGATFASLAARKKTGVVTVTQVGKGRQQLDNRTFRERWQNI